MTTPLDPAMMPAIPLDLLPQAALVADGSGRLTALNQAAADLLGRSLEEVLARRIDTPMDLRGEDGQRLPREAWPVDRTLATGEPCACIVGLGLADGHRRWLHVTTSLLPDGSVLALFSDRTRQQTLHQLLEARARIHSIAQNGNLEDVLRSTLDEAEALTDSCIGFYHFVEPDQITLSLQAWSTRTARDYCKAEGKGQHYSVDQAGVWVDALRQGRAVIHNDYASLPHRKGLPEGHAALVREAVVTVHRGGRIQAVLGVGNKATLYTQQDLDLLQELADLAWEIAEHKRSQEWLELRDQALEQSLSAFILTDGEGHLRHVNPAFLRFWGYQSPQEVLGRSRIGFWEDAEAALQLASLAAAQGTATGDLTALRADGSTFLAEARLSVVKDGQGRILAMLGTASDITEQRRAQRVIQEQKEALERFFQASVDLLCLADTMGRLLRVNEAWGRVLGYTVEELEGTNFLDLLHPEDREPTREAMAVLALDQPVIDFVNRYRAKDGGWHSLEWRAVAKAGVISAGARDITERLETERRLRESEALFALFMAHSPIYVFIKEVEPTQSRVLMASDNFVDMVGIPGRAMIGKTMEELFPEDFARKITADDWATACSGDVLRLDEALGDRSYTTIKFPLRQGERTLLAGFTIDITDRKRAAAELRATNQRLAQLSEAMNQSPVSLVITDTRGTIEYVNPAFERSTGYTAAEVLGKNPRFLKSGAQDAAFYRDLWQQLARGEAWEGRFHNRRKDGSLIWEQARISPVRDEAGRIVRYLALKEDISEAIRLAEERMRLEAQLLQAQRLESLGSLAGGVAHDMNNVLMAILGLATALRASEEAGTVRGRSMDTIISACQKGGQMVRSLLDFARKGSGDRRILDLNALVQEEVDLLERTTLNRVRVVTELAEDLPGVHGDGSALAHALMNLCVNAVDAMEPGGTLTLRTRLDEGGWVVCTVEDTGCGMPPEVMARALEPYFTTKPEGKGTGLGLAMAYGTLQSHGGTLSLSSTSGQGTTVTLRLPPAEPVHSPEAAVDTSPSGPMGRRILVVDDDDLVRTSTESLLELLDVTTESVASGEEALARLEHMPGFDLVILDMNMPGLGGAGTLPRLRHSHPDLPVLLATGRADSTAEALVGAHPGVRLLSKPYSLDDLNRAIHASF